MKNKTGVPSLINSFQSCETIILLDKIAGFPILNSFAKHIRRFGSVLFALWRGEERCLLLEHRFRSSPAFKRACQRRRPSPCRLLPIHPPGNRNSSINCGKLCTRAITAVEPSRPTAIGSNASSFSTMCVIRRIWPNRKSTPMSSTAARRAFAVRWTGFEVTSGGFHADPHKMP